MMTFEKDGMRLEPLERGSWRLIDTEVDEHSVERVVAYVEEAALGHYEVVWINAGPEIRSYPSRSALLNEAGWHRAPLSVRSSGSDELIPAPTAA